MLIEIQPRLVDHPTMSNGWFGGEIDETYADMLVRRFEGVKTVDPEGLIAVVGLSDARSRMYRDLRERENRQCLDLSEEGYAEYRHGAGRPDRMGEHVFWFDRAAARIFGGQPSNKVPAKVSLELGGRQQWGDWEATAALDRSVQSLPDQLSVVGKELSVYWHMHHQDTRYTFMPIRDADPGFGFGELCRRRSVAEVLGGVGCVSIFEETRAVIVVSQLSPLQRKRVNDTCIPNYKPTKNDAPANIAGLAYERARKEMRDYATDAVPVSTRYIAMIRNPQVEAAVT